MPGPGGPPGHQFATPAEGIKEQVLLATLPDSNPDVHLARLDVASAAFSLRQACVSPTGGVSLEAEYTLPLKGLTVTRGGELSLSLRKDDGQTVQLHFENQDDERSWTVALGDAKAFADNAHAVQAGATASAVAGAGAGDGDDIAALKARSAALQDRIGSLEAVRERRDKQLEALTSRLEDALKMLGAVEDMCCQQQRVIDAQRVAITELRRDAGLNSDDEAEEKAASLSGTSTPPAASQAPATPAAAAAPPAAPATVAVPASEVVAPAAATAPSLGEMAESLELEMPAEAEEMLKLFQQADEMQQALRQLQAMSGGARPAPAGPVRDSPADRGQDDDDTRGEHQDPDHGQSENERVLNRIRSLESEKERFEAMIRDSQNEHEELMQQLTGMRSLMSTLGIREEELSEPEEEDAGGHASGITSST